MTIDTSKPYAGVLKTDAGEITIRLLPDVAPVLADRLDRRQGRTAA